MYNNILEIIYSFEPYSLQAISIYALSFVFLIQMIYYWIFFRKLAFYKEKKSDTNLQAVSVVVCAHNEFQNIREFLPMILEQDYPNYEVILVNDDSDDNTEFLLIDLKAKYPHFKVAKTNRTVSFVRGKKFPLSVGIKLAQNPVVLLTDADCYPQSKNWIRGMMSAYADEKTEFVLGYGKYEKKPGLLNRLVRYDTLHTGIQYLSAAIGGRPYMGVGRNLSYTKDIFVKNKGLTSHYKIPFGDDDLFVNKYAHKRNTSISISSDAHTVSIPPRNFKSWFRQKKRHLAASKHYKFSTKIRTGTYGLSAFLFHVLTIIAVVFSFSNYFLCSIIGFIYIFRLSSQLVIFYKSAKKLEEKGLWFRAPIYDFYFSVLNPIWMFSNYIIKENVWK